MIFEEGFTIRIWITENELDFKVVMPNHYYLAIVYLGYSGAEDHLQSDMVLWQASGSDSAVFDLWSASWENPVPVIDEVNDYTTTMEYDAERQSVTFESKRALDTGDEFDYVVESN